MISFQESIKLLTILTLVLLGIGIFVTPALAQEGKQQEPGAFIYTVQPGDTLAAIALRYNRNLFDIALANNLSNFDLIFPGQRLTLPNISAQIAATPQGDGRTHIVRPGDTLFSIANIYGVSPEAIVGVNRLVNPDFLQVGQTLKIPGGPQTEPEKLPTPFASVELSEPTIIQGRTLIIWVKLAAAATLSGDFDNRPILFNDGGNGQFWGITAIPALAEPKIYPLKLTANLVDGSQVTVLRNVNVIEGPYGVESIQVDEQREELLDPEIVQVEQAKLDYLWSQISPRPLWQGSFHYPMPPDTLRLTSYFGTRRSYNGGEIASFHAGTDFGGDVGVPIYAPAAGKVVLAEKLMVRGNAVVIDHGLGLFSGYWHQNQLAVVVDQEVKPGDLIGFIGDTGLVTGPHLHWEVRLNGIAIEPLQWVQQMIP
ncbi:MAG: LysM peptidoglycan-binding domain-containing M23 family metallopeptidase [Anaerolineales bacterium]|nr:LysM peptidoglycan-binding domain-containing M23 family metallopeptidase [Anaerolineales bacterium]